MLKLTGMKSWIAGLAALIAISLIGGAQPAWAHPHVWIQVRTLLLVEGGALTGLHHIWVLDEAWLTSQIEEHDADKDGKLSPTELAAVAVQSRATLDMFKSFTTIRHGGNRIRPGAPRDVSTSYYGEFLGMSFVVPLPKPIPLAGADLLLEVYDGTYFSGFSFAGDDAVAFAGERPDGCTIKANATPSAQQSAAYRMIARQLGPEFVAKGVTLGAVAVVCGGTKTSAVEAVGVVGGR